MVVIEDGARRTVLEEIERIEQELDTLPDWLRRHLLIVVDTYRYRGDR